jgi:hypothetical protein
MPKTASNLNINLSAIVYREKSDWIAHCLELDIVAEGTSRQDAIQSLISLCDLQIETALEEGDLESIFRPAPPEFWKMFASGKKRTLSEKGGKSRRARFESPVNRFEAREMAFN